MFHQTPMLHYWNQQCYISLSTTLVTQNKTASGGSYHFGNQDDGNNFGLVPPPPGSLDFGSNKPSQKAINVTVSKIISFWDADSF